MEKGLVSALSDEKSFVRQAAAERLGEHKVRWTIQPLIQLLKDPDPFVREAVDDNSLSLHGLWTDIGEGGLQCFDPETGKFDVV